METLGSNTEIVSLFESLLDSLHKTSKSKKKFIEKPANLFYELYHMTPNNLAKILSESAVYIEESRAKLLIDKGLLQAIESNHMQRYSLSFKGIAVCVRLKFGHTMEEQFLSFLGAADREFSSSTQESLKGDEKMVSLALILIGATSISSAIRLNNETNQKLLADVFTRVLDSLKRFKIVGEQMKLKSTARREAPASAVMSRVNELRRKTNQYFTNLPEESGYYLDIERDGEVDKGRLYFLMKRIIECCNPTSNYDEMYDELLATCQAFHPAFSDRSLNTRAVLSILGDLKEFMQIEVLHLPRCDGA